MVGKVDLYYSTVRYGSRDLRVVDVVDLCYGTVRYVCIHRPEGS